MNRRTFLKASGGVLAAGTLVGGWLGWRRLEDRRWLIVPHAENPIDMETVYEEVKPRPGELRLFDAGWRLRRRVALPFHAHSIVQDPAWPDRVYAISKWGRSMASVDLRRGEMERLIESPPATRFFGHGLFRADGDLLVSARDDERGRGQILRYRGPDLVGRYDSFGSFPHEFRFHPRDPAVLVIANGAARGPSYVTWIGYEDERILQAVPSQLNRNIGHFQFLDDSGQRILLYGVHSAPAVDLIDGQDVRHLVAEGRVVAKDRKIETLNAIRSPIDPNVYWVTCPGADLLLSIDVRTRRLLALETHSSAKNIFTRGQELYLSEEEGGSMRLRRRSGEEWTTPEVPDFGTGSHVTWIRAPDLPEDPS